MARQSHDPNTPKTPSDVPSDSLKEKQEELYYFEHGHAELSPREQLEYLKIISATIEKEKLIYLRLPLALQTLSATLIHKHQYRTPELQEREKVTAKSWHDYKAGLIQYSAHAKLLDENAAFLLKIVTDPTLDLFNKYDKQRTVKKQLTLAHLSIETALANNNKDALAQIENQFQMTKEDLNRSFRDVKVIRATTQNIYDTLLQSHIPLVVSIITRKIKPRSNLDDLISAGIEGLMIAIENFNFGTGTKFSTYASNWIVQSAYMEFKRILNPIHIPADLVTLHKNSLRVQDNIKETQLYEPSLAEVANELKTTPENIARISAVLGTLSLEHKVEGSRGTTRELLFGNLITDDGFSKKDKPAFDVGILSEIFSKLPLLYSHRQIQYVKAFCRIEIDSSGDAKVAKLPLATRKNFRSFWGFSPQMANTFGKNALDMMGCLAHLHHVPTSEIIQATRNFISPQGLFILLNILRDSPIPVKDIARLPIVMNKLAPAHDLSKATKKTNDFIQDELREFSRDLIWTTSSYLIWHGLSNSEKADALGKKAKTPEGRALVKYLERFHENFPQFTVSSQSFLRAERITPYAPHVRCLIELVGNETLRSLRGHAL